MRACELKQRYIDFFKSKEHAEVPGASLIPEHDPTVLFTTAGMHPLVPFLMGQSHPLGRRIVNVQKCLRTGDIEEVGDSTHHTFFEMLGNWSFGDYFKEQAIQWSYEFLTDKQWLGLDPERLAITCFAGDKDAPKDTESAEIWMRAGIPEPRIAFLGKEDNWWGPAGNTGPCGPDTEMFYWVDDSTPAPKEFDPDDERWVEIWNDVFMQYDKQQRVILIDGMDCLYDEGFTINHALLDLLDSYSAKKILVINAFGEKARKLLAGHGIDVFTFEKEIKKAEPEFFKRLLKKYTLVPEQCLYLDHSEANLEGARQAGIAALQLNAGDAKAAKGFIDEHLVYFKPLSQKSVDTGFGLERVTAIMQGFDDNYRTELFWPVIEQLQRLSGKRYEDETHSMRVVADHLRAAVFILGDERSITPSNLDQGYILRRFIRRTIRHLKQLGVDFDTQPLIKMANVVIEQYKDAYPLLLEKQRFILDELEAERKKFLTTLENGMRVLQREIEKLARKEKTTDPEYKGLYPGDAAFLLFQSYGFPIELTQEILAERGMAVDMKEYNRAYERHQELSRVGAEQKFKGGLADASEQTTKLHTATHLLNEALRKVLSPDIKQRGSNITPERLRFDFNFDRKLTQEELQSVEEEVNRVIKLSLPVTKTEMTPDEAIAKGAQAEFGARYPARVSVYKVGDYSMEICMGPHVKNTAELGSFRIKKEQSIAAGIRRIKAVLE